MFEAPALSDCSF